jgi:hypothetical protein
MGDPENGGCFTVKEYHSAKTVSEDAWQHDRIELLPLNTDYDPIPSRPTKARKWWWSANGWHPSTEPWTGTKRTFSAFCLLKSFGLSSP